MNKSCFKAKKEFDKNKIEFVKFSQQHGKEVNLFKCKKTYKKTLYLTEKAFKEENLITIAELNKRVPTQFWTTVKSLLNNTTRNIPNSIHPNTWKPYFQKLLNIQTGQNNSSNVIERLTKLENKMVNKQGPLDFDFNTDKIILVIESLKSNRANFGVVTNEILRCSPSAIAKPLSYLFNLILGTRVFPSTWNLSLIKPLHKTGSHSKHRNYRGICISNHLSKLFTAILHRRLEKWSIQNSILPNKSLGFRKGLRWNLRLDNYTSNLRIVRQVLRLSIEYSS